MHYFHKLLYQCIGSTFNEEDDALIGFNETIIHHALTRLIDFYQFIIKYPNRAFEKAFYHDEVHGRTPAKNV